jgi:hypothetical protein
MGREKLLSFSKLLNRVKFQNNWSSDSFVDCAKRTDGVSQSEGFRFHKALVSLGYIVKSGRSYKPVFDTKVWNDEDFRLNIINNILEDQPVIQKRGRVKGKVYDKPVAAVVVTEPAYPLEKFSAKDLVAELRRRGFEVTCKRSVTVVEEL